MSSYSYEKHARAPSFSSHDSSSSEPAHTRRRIVPDPVILGAHDAPPVPPGGLSELELKGWAQAVAQDAEARLAQTVLSRTPMGDVLEDRAATIADAMVFSDKVKMTGTPITDQQNSGRCWLFSMLNVLRVSVADKHKLGEFQLSQSYMSFWDKWNKANYFLEQALELFALGEPLDSRTMKELMKKPVDDGGNYTLAVSLLVSVGVVPQTVFPETWSSDNTEQVNNLVASKLREIALDLRRQIEASKRTGTSTSEAIRRARDTKTYRLKEVWRVLCINLGTPPDPHKPFLWEFTDKDGKYRAINVPSPVTFVHNEITYDVANTVALNHDPRESSRLNAVYETDRGAGLVGAVNTKYLNIDMPLMKKIAIELIKNNHPVWFGCDVDKASNAGDGFMDLKLYNYDNVFGTSLGLTKPQRLATGDGSPTHAMVLTAVHIDPVTKKPVRWQVENSWGPDVCQKGFIVMTDEWFDEHVYQLACPLPMLPLYLQEIYRIAKPFKLPLWDPFS